MALVELSVGRSKYKIECPESERNKLTSLAKKVDSRMQKLSQSFKNVDEKTLLLIASLTMEDELENSHKPDNDPVDTDVIYENLAQNIHNMTRDIEKLIHKIESR